MTYENILYSIDERVCTISLNRPEKMNALSWALRLELQDSLKRAERDPDVGCIVIKGEGRAFSAGYDLTPTHPSPNRPVDGYVSDDVDRLTAQYARDLVNGLWNIWELTKPVIAQVHGWCLAGASELASMCDIMFVAEDARLGYPPVRALTTPDTMYFPWKMPMSWAKYLMFTGRAVTGLEAVEIGWATKAFPADRLDATRRDGISVLEKQGQCLDRVRDDLVERVGCREAARHVRETDPVGAVGILVDHSNIMHGPTLLTSSRPTWRWHGPFPPEDPSSGAARSP
jgi:enoyl-CoA hydratase